MKKIPLLLLVILSLFAYACSDSNEATTSDDPNADLNNVISATNTYFTGIVAGLQADVNNVGQNDLDSAAIRALLKSFLTKNTLIEEYGYFNSKGILQIIEPAKYYAYEGTDMSSSDELKAVLASKQMGTSTLFKAVEGYYAAAIIYPIFKNDEFKGAFDLLFKPNVILKEIIEPVEKAKNMHLWVMQKGGKVLYDADTTEIGYNVYTDTMYQNMPTFLAAVKLIDSLESGSTNYEYTDWYTKEFVQKACHWKTYSFYGVTWRFIWTKKTN